MASTMDNHKFAGELRNNLYHYLNPLNAHISEYRGFLMANKPTLREAEGIILKQTKAILNDIIKEWRGVYPDFELRIAMPTSLRDLKYVMVELPKSFFNQQLDLPVLTRGASDQQRGPLARLFELHVSTLTFKLYDDSDWNPLYLHPLHRDRGPFMPNLGRFYREIFDLTRTRKTMLPDTPDSPSSISSIEYNWETAQEVGAIMADSVVCEWGYTNTPISMRNVDLSNIFAVFMPAIFEIMLEQWDMSSWWDVSAYRRDRVVVRVVEDRSRPFPPGSMATLTRDSYNLSYAIGVVFDKIHSRTPDCMRITYEKDFH